MPTRIGPYAVVRRLGQGGMGVVYEVQDPLAPRTLAMKLLLDQDPDEVAVERFWREAEVLAKVRHRGVVRVHRAGRLSEGPFLLAELVPGEGLDRVVAARGPLDPREAARLARELADALVAVHAHGVLHRDLKPSNVMLQPDGIPVLLDFGLCRDAGARRLTVTGQAMGSPSYMAPEQVSESPRTLGPQVDVYGVGAVLHELLTGRPPFDGGSPLATMRLVLTRDPPSPRDARPEVPPELDRLVCRALAKDPGARQPTAAALRDDLDAFLAGRRRPAGAALPGRRAARWAAGALGLVVVVALVATTSRDPRVEGGATVGASRTGARAAPRPVTAGPAVAPASGRWSSLVAGRPARYALTLTEEDGRVRVRLRVELAWVAAAHADGALQVTAAFEALDGDYGLVGFGDPRGGSTQGPDGEGPLTAVLRRYVGVRAVFALDPGGGLLAPDGGARLSGLATTARAVRDLGVQDGDFRVSEYVRSGLCDEAVGAALATLLPGSAGTRLRWRERGGGAWDLREERVGAPLDTVLGPFTREAARVRLEGQATFDEGGLRAATLSQEVLGHTLTSGAAAKDTPPGDLVTATLERLGPP